MSKSRLSIAQFYNYNLSKNKIRFSQILNQRQFNLMKGPGGKVESRVSVNVYEID